MTREEAAGFVERYVAAWASREPNEMAKMWHADGVLHHPLLGGPIAGRLVPANNDRTKRLIPDLVWSLQSWAWSGDVVFLEWRNTGTFEGRRIEFEGVDRMIVKEGRIREEAVYLDSLPLWELVDPSMRRPPLLDPADLEPPDGGDEP
jgi:hypothetical protein